VTETFPVTVFVPLPRLRVPPAVLTARAPSDEFPWRVAIPEVLEPVRVPLVVKAAMEGVATVPLIVTLFEPKLRVPPPVFDRFP
jgi:hypothetical protein